MKPSHTVSRSGTAVIMRLAGLAGDLCNERVAPWHVFETAIEERQQVHECFCPTFGLRVGVGQGDALVKRSLTLTGLQFKR